MHNSTTSEIKCTFLLQETTFNQLSCRSCCIFNGVRTSPEPDHVCNRQVAECEPQHDECQYCAEFCTFSKRADDQTASNRCKRCLESDINKLRNHNTFAECCSGRECNSFIGGFDRVFLKGIWDPVKGTFATAATFSKGVVIPEFVYVAFQATFAAITCGLIIGAFAERAKFSAVLAFVVLWFTFSYLPIAHMVWFWTGPDAIKDAATA